ncbi:hypothetical protein A2803_03005 [Candidatus Woesebacteria bacterium RIFCSPHIGHO2_01_FULL_44_21]|uniref:Type II secretion system protein GspG C-terminal domain-containing protein n=1 Tax=Candidatus Woesebacteria bacterium RIFCSPHIGHO2_01_FULL_44_21 TaxID=1802503 RepID=A0A1F7Z0H2_9BACT|nr:MAG: hypothetical protein A2803_03005 [Candidatus Woesebacteria bacterium RIFCSPHIGHO2_01_FULL_44_21]OGM69216.1 MAG: hypothetical protein A2897_04375 [Candidatus Woesebacteria bacterium RIFCSPLOWO2_01_FULL_44_24b]
MSFKLKKGFTLIELLIVIAILGTLAVVVLIALNPVQQLARTRDAGRRSTVSQLGHAVEARATGNNGVYVTAAAAWVTGLVNAGEIASVPQNPTYSAPGVGSHPQGADCSVNAEGDFCYSTSAAPASRAIVFARLESAAENEKCGASQAAWAVYSTANSGAGIFCNDGSAPAVPGVGGYTGSTWIQ